MKTLFSLMLVITSVFFANSFFAQNPYESTSIRIDLANAKYYEKEAFFEGLENLNVAPEDILVLKQDSTESVTILPAKDKASVEKDAKKPLGDSSTVLSIVAGVICFIAAFAILRKNFSLDEM